MKEASQVSRIAEQFPAAKRKLGRPPKAPAERRTERVDVFFSVAERVKLTEDARACGLSPAAYIRKLVAGYRPTAQAEQTADPRLLLELNAIGNNLGQTVASMNCDHPAKAAWRALKRDLQDMLQRVALEEISVSPRLVVKLNAVGTLLNRAVADLHAGSSRSHDWQAIYESLHGLLLEVATSHVH